MGKNTQPGVKLCRPSAFGFWSTSTRSVVGDRYQTPPHRGEITTGESPARRASWRRTTSGPHHGVCAREDRYIQCPRSPRDDQTLGHRDEPHQHCIQHPHCDRPAKSPASAIEQPAATERMGGEKRVATTVRIRRFGLRTDIKRHGFRHFSGVTRRYSGRKTKS